MNSYKNYRIALTCLVIGGLFLSDLSAKSKRHPYIEETEQGRQLIIPEKVDLHLAAEFPGYKIPSEADFDPVMLKYYHRELVGIHPAITWGDFNKDKKTDYAFLLVTGESPWGPLVELIVINGQRKKGRFETFRLGEIYGFKDDYLRFRDGKLSKGDYKKGAWYINWDKKEKEYITRKS